mmetsp:Transcript_12495/g.26743  ORF Transcript_12495/g.26743 Transcript_12495/m.26743 type:complete len:201 (-) Transcript_12495:62-664(-)
MAVRWLEWAAKHSHVNAAAELGQRLAQRADERAEGFLQQAADAGHAQATFNLAVLLSRQEKYSEAAILQEVSCRQGVLLGCTALGASQLAGRGLEKDESAAFRSFSLAAQGGELEGMYRVGAMLDAGIGTRRDQERAASWYEKAALQGHMQAQYGLGELCAWGLGGKAQDPKEARKWFQLAGARGHVMAKRRLRDVDFIE